MTEFEKIYQNYNPRQAALDEARALLTAAAKAAMADGALPEAELPAFIVEIPADTKNGDSLMANTDQFIIDRICPGTHHDHFTVIRVQDMIGVT